MAQEGELDPVDVTRLEPPPPGSSSGLSPLHTPSASGPPIEPVAVGPTPSPGRPTPSGRLAPLGGGGGRYEVQQLLGKGGMGEVFAARDRDLRRRVALKVAKLPPGRPDLLERFLAETQVTAQLDHAGIVPVYSLEMQEDGSPAYAMKLVEGRGLDDVLEAARTAPAADADRLLRDRLEVFLRVCDAVGFAHRKGVTHRDLKPANVMVGRFGEVYVVDWGLAKARGSPEVVPSAEARDEDPTAQTQAGTLVGTPAYMAPEQALGDHARVGPRSDQFALGLMLWELITLERAYGASTVAAVVHQAISGKRTPRPGAVVAPELQAIVDKATAVDPEARYATVADLAEDVRRVLAGLAPRARPDGAWRAFVRRVARRPGRLVGAVVVTVALAGAAVLLVEHRRRLALAEARVRAQEREQRLGAVLARVAEQAQRVTNEVLGHEALVEGLAGAATQALLGPPPASGADETRLFGPDAWAEAGAREEPPGTSASVRYGRRVSLQVPVALVAGDGEAGRAQLRRLATLAPRLRAVLQSDPEGALHGAGWEQRVLEAGASVAWAYVATEETGAIVLLPGMRTTWAPSYDPRRRPWYQDAAEAWRRGVRRRAWSAPYVDGLLGRPVLACVAPCVGERGELLGVAATDLFARDLVARALRPAQARRAALLDGAGRELLSSELLDAARPPAVDAEGRLVLRPYRFPGVVDAVREGRSGHQQGVDEGTGVLIVWTRLAPLPWTLAVELDAEAAGLAPGAP